MGKSKPCRENFAHAITPEQIERFAHMTTLERLRWLDEANAFINRFVGVEARARWDSRFEVYLKKKGKG